MTGSTASPTPTPRGELNGLAGSRESPRRVAVLVVTYNSAAHVDAMLDSLPAAFGHVKGTVVVVDNGSTDATLEVLARRSDDVIVVTSTNTGFAAGINLAVRHSGDADALLLLNPDATLGAGSVPAMLDALARPGVGIVAPKVLEADGRLSPSLRRSPSLLRVGSLGFTGIPALCERIDNPREYDAPHVVDWAMGAVLLVARECYDALGGLDESFFLYSEETDFCLRARDAGWATFYAPDALSTHLGGGSGENATTYTMREVNRVRIYRRRHGTAASWTYYWLMVATELGRAVLGRAEARAAFHALVRPSRRPVQLASADHLLPM